MPSSGGKENAYFASLVGLGLMTRNSCFVIVETAA